ncbi:MAG: tandem-95 repeat protein [Rhodanobacteraceae bacterium]|nr:tandem-95 repeat protein [Rhodanobacteraceae bacterium]
MKRSLLSVALSAALVQGAWAQSNPGESGQPPIATDGSIPVTYVGSNARVSLGVNDDLDVLGELMFVFGEDGDSAWLTEAWLGQGGAGGVKLDYHWLWGGMSVEDTMARPEQVKVAKAFLAVDQNPFKDRKVSLGFGMEREHSSWDLYLSHAITDERQIGIDTLIDNVLLSGMEGDRPYEQLETTTTITRTFVKPYDWGVGLRGGRWFDQPLIRLRAGLDYETGDYDSDQTTFSLGIDKQFRNSPHSLSLEIESYHKTGLFEIDRNDTRAWLLWRYDFGSGSNFRATNPTRDVEVSREVAGDPQPPIVVRNEIAFSDDTYFGFDSSAVQNDAQTELDAVLAAITGGKRVSRVTLTGHTCDIGAESYNQGLSERRAGAVRDYLVSQGVPAGEIDVTGRGELEPKFPNDGEENRRKNRRVDIEFLTVEEHSEPAPPTTKTITEWVKEPVAAPPAWIQRALRNPARHKRTVDVYRFQTVETNTTLGERQYLNRAPVAADDAVSQHACELISIPVLANDSDPDGDALSIVAIGATQNGGSVTDNGDGTLGYEPPQDGAVCAGGGDSFTYTVADPSGAESTATVSVGFENVAPVAMDDSGTTDYQMPAFIDALANDSDADGDTLTIVGTTDGAHGYVEIGEDGRLHYVPESGFSGVDQFTYTISDGRETATANVTVTVEAPVDPDNNPPVALADVATTMTGVPVDINVLANDSDADGDTISLVSTSIPTHGSVSIQGDHVVYTPEAGFNGIDSFTYTISDGQDTATAMVSVTVSADGDPDNHPPIARNDIYNYRPGQAVTMNVLHNDEDPDHDELTIIDVQGSEHGTVSIVDGGTRLRWIPDDGYKSLEYLVYTISDGRGGTASAVVTLYDP